MTEIPWCLVSVANTVSSFFKEENGKQENSSKEECFQKMSRLFRKCQDCPVHNLAAVHEISGPLSQRARNHSACPRWATVTHCVLSLSSRQGALGWALAGGGLSRAQCPLACHQPCVPAGSCWWPWAETLALERGLCCSPLRNNLYLRQRKAEASSNR